LRPDRHSSRRGLFNEDVQCLRDEGLMSRESSKMPKKKRLWAKRGKIFRSDSAGEVARGPRCSNHLGHEIVRPPFLRGGGFAQNCPSASGAATRSASFAQVPVR